MDFRPVNAWKPPRSNIVDLTLDNLTGRFDPDEALGIDRYGSYDASNYVDVAQATENIKALLEGAFEDDEDKPRTRLRKKKLAADSPTLSKEIRDPKIQDDHVVDDDEDDGTVEGLNIKLLPHQIDGVAWMLDKEVGTRKKNGVLPKGGILADDMGLGKTIQALALILTNRRPSADDLAENPKLKIPETAGKGTLIVAPLSLIKQWESEIKTKVVTFPSTKILVHHGPSRTKRYDELKKYDIVITTYQTLTSEHSDSSAGDGGLKVGCFGNHWYRVILDEAHSIKNRNAKMTKAAYDLQAVYRWCLTGTPMQNNLDELQSLIRFLKIKPYCELAVWREQIGLPMKNGRGGLAMKRLQYFLKAFMKRRTKEVLKKEGGLNFGRVGGHQNESSTAGFKLVARNVQRVVTEFDPAEREFYRRLEERTKANLVAMMEAEKSDYMGALVLLLRLRQTCNHPDLIKSNIRKDKESVSVQQSFGFPSPRKPAKSGIEVDDVADMLGALTVKTRICDGCGSKLNRDEIDKALVRCLECEQDMRELRRQSDSIIETQKLATKASKGNHPVKKRTNIRRIIDSDDEEDEGELLTSKHQSPKADIETSNGKDNDDVDSGAEWLGEDDSDTPDETDCSEVDRPAAQDIGGGNSSSRMVASSKIRQLIKILEAESDDHKFIVFSEFTSMLDIVEPFLRNAGFRFTRYDGSMKNDEREASLERLRTDRRTRILLCSLRCGSLGLNLTAASRVVILEPFWNPVSLSRRVSRHPANFALVCRRASD